MRSAKLPISVLGMCIGSNRQKHITLLCAPGRQECAILIDQHIAQTTMFTQTMYLHAAYEIGDVIADQE
jgi:hypothetical protein